MMTGMYDVRVLVLLKVQLQSKRWTIFAAYVDFMSFQNFISVSADSSNWTMSR